MYVTPVVCSSSCSLLQHVYTLQLIIVWFINFIPYMVLIAIATGLNEWMQPMIHLQRGSYTCKLEYVRMFVRFSYRALRIFHSRKDHSYGSGIARLSC